MEETENQGLPPLDSSNSPSENPHAPAPMISEEELLPKLNNKRKRPVVAMKSVGRRPLPMIAPPAKKQRIMESFNSGDDFYEHFEGAPEFDHQDDFDFDPDMNAPMGGILQGGMASIVDPTALGSHDFDFDECPFTEEEMNAPIVVPPQPNGQATSFEPLPDSGHQQSAYVYDQGFDFDTARGQDFEANPWDMQEEFQISGKKTRKPRKKSTTRKRTVRNSTTVSLSALLDNTDGVDPQYHRERKQFYDALEAHLKRPPDVNLLCGAPVDLYQLYTECVNRGGYDAVCTAKQWRQIFRQLPQYSNTHTSASYALKKMYRKNLSSYENTQRNSFQQQ